MPWRKRTSQQHGVAWRRAAAGEPATVGHARARAATAVRCGLILYYDRCRGIGTAVVSNAGGGASLPPALPVRSCRVDATPGRALPVVGIGAVGGRETVACKQGESNTESATITLADSHKRDELLNALTNALGPGWQRDRQRASRLRTALWPLGTLAVVSVLTWTMYGEAQLIATGRHMDVHAHSRRQRALLGIMHWVEGLIGATGVLILGGLLACVCLAWLG